MEYLDIYSIITAIFTGLVSLLFLVLGIIMVTKTKGLPSYLVLVGSILGILFISGRFVLSILFGQHSVEALVNAQMIFNVFAVLPSLLIVTGLIAFVINLPKTKN